MIGDLFDSPWKILIVAAVILVLFGSAKLPGAARSLGKSMRILKAEVKDLHEEETEPATAGPGIAGPQPIAAQPPLAAQQLEAQKLAAQQLEAQQAEQAQQRIDALQRQLDDLKQPVAGAHSAQRTVQPTGQSTQ
jgi:sec-independent protein translocase protein TatA